MNGKYYIKFGLHNKNNAGSKAMKDVMELLEKSGYHAVLSLPVNCSKWMKTIDIPLLLFTLFFRGGKGGAVLYFVPSNSFRIWLLGILRNLLGFQLVCFINDVESMRMEDLLERRKKEIDAIACADVILAPNENSCRILREDYGIYKRMIPVQVWDYLHPKSFCDSYPDGSICFAGNLMKAPFINQLHRLNLSFKIWGDGCSPKKVGNLQFMGVESPEYLPIEIRHSSWGLVWDGTSIETCAGLLGTYQRFNNPHKCGLYLASGIPVIVWRESGMASFVEHHQVGICVSSLYEAEHIIHTMKDEEYEHYRKNAAAMAPLLRKGFFFLSALSEI